MKKRAVSSLLASLAVVSLVLPALAVTPSKQGAAPQPITASVETVPGSIVYLDGVCQQSVVYEIRNGVTYVTVASFVSMVDPEAVVEEEGSTVTVSSAKVSQVVDAAGNTANVVEETLSMTVSSKIPYIVANGRYLYAKDSIIWLNGSLAVPVRILAQVFNLDVSYDGRIILNHRNSAEGAYLLPGDSYYNSDTLYWLSRVINAESGNQILAGKIAVGNVVMNRVNSPKFPNTIYKVLYQKNQFSTASSGSLKKTPNAESVIAAKLVMEGVEIVPTALFFNQAGLSCYASRNRTYVTTIGAHAFYA